MKEKIIINDVHRCSCNKQSYKQCYCSPWTLSITVCSLQNKYITKVQIRFINSKLLFSNIKILKWNFLLKKIKKKYIYKLIITVQHSDKLYKQTAGIFVLA